jgi:hypothetical protein
MRGIRAFVREQPFWVDFIALVLVCAHATLTALGWIPNVWAVLQGAGRVEGAQSLYLGMLGPAAIVAGFAGVVVVFGLSAGSSRFTRFRARAGNSLKRTWVASTLAGFEAAGLCTAATVINWMDTVQWVAPFTFELALWLMLHGSGRLVWILSEMIGITRADDIRSTDEASAFPVSRLPFNRRNAG